LPAVDLLEAEVLKRDLDSLERLAEERVLAARAGRVVLRVAGRKEPAGDARPRAVEVVGALRAVASTASHYVELTCIVIIIVIIFLWMIANHCGSFRANK